MMNTAICGSGAPLLERVLLELGDEAGIEIKVDSYGTYTQLKEALQSKSYELLLLDTSLDGEDGIEFAVELRREKNNSEIIFMSSGTQDAYAAYAAFPLGYLLKPLSKKKLRTPFLRAADRHAGKKCVVLNSADGGKVTLSLEELRYIEVIGTELFVHTGVGVIKCIGPLAETCKQLPTGMFYRSHRSFIVNMNYVVRTMRYYFVMDNGKKVTIAKNRYAQAKQQLQEFFGE